jgi:hypothetical protein
VRNKIETVAQVFEKGDILAALASSMAVPVLFKAVWLEGRPLVDGAVLDIAGMQGVSRTNRVLYHHATLTPPSWTILNEFKHSITLHSKSKH